MIPADLNLLVAWLGIVGGVVSGAVIGLFFHRETWLGGYDAWRRRMLRLGHIAFFGIAFLNLAFAVSVTQPGWAGAPPLAGWSLAAANVLMPAVCFAAAWKKPLRHLFPIPVTAVAAGVIGLLAGRVL